MTLLTKTFPPSDALYPYIEVFLYWATHGAHKTNCLDPGKERNEIMQIAQVALRKLEERKKLGPKETAPSEEEIKALRAEQPIKLSVYFTDHSFKKVMIDADTCVDDMLKTISATLKVRAIDTYALYDVSTGYDPTVLDGKLNIMNVIDEWQKIVKLGKGRFAKKCEACC